MAVPRRRQSGGLVKFGKLSSRILSMLDVNYIFAKTRTLLLYGFAPAVVLIGLRTEPRPSPWDLVNIWE
jgi:hypothetical protein